MEIFKSISDYYKENSKKIIEGYLFGGLIVYFLFPLINYIRRLFIDVYEFGLWRDFFLFYLFFFIWLVLFDVILNGLKKRIKEVFDYFKNNKLDLLFVLFVLYITISTIITGVSYESIMGQTRSRTGLLYYCSFIFYYMVGNKIKDEKKKRALIKILCVVSFILSLIVLYYVYILNESELIFDYSYMFYNRNHFDYYLVTMAILSFSSVITSKDKKDIIFYGLSFVVTFMTLLLNNTLGGYLAFIVTVIFLFIIIFLYNKKLLKKTLIMTLVLMLFTFLLVRYDSHIGDVASENIDVTVDLTQKIESDTLSDKDGSFRVILWKAASKMIKEKPIFGFGIHDMRVKLYVETDGHNTVHNEFLEYGIIYGVPAMVLYVVMILCVYLKGLKYKKKINDINVVCLLAALAYLASSFVGVTMFYTAPYMFILLGIGNQIDLRG